MYCTVTVVRFVIILIKFYVCMYVQYRNVINSLEVMFMCGLPQWLSGLRHSAHRPERPAGGAGVQSPVGR